MFMSCYEYLVIFVCDQGKHFSRMKTSHRKEVGTGGKWEGVDCGGRIRPKIFRRLKFPKTPFSHL